MAAAVRIIGRGLAAAAGLVLLAAHPAHADLKLCNRLSYVVETAIGVDDHGAAATRGWFRIDPGQCRGVLQGAVQVEHLYVHARALPVYGPSPLPQNGHADLCVADTEFVIAAARTCNGGQRLVRFTEIKPAETPDGMVAILAEESDYTDDQARLAGIQRLLVISGYDANPIDGVPGRKTEAAVAQFVKDRGLAAAAADEAGFFDVLIDAGQKPAATGLSWCNDTRYPVMAALGSDEKGAIVTRGWYRVEPGKCLRPELFPQTRRVFSYAEAVEADGKVVSRGGKALAWGGGSMLCTREAKFEFGDQKDCNAKGLVPTGFAAVDLPAKGGTTVRFKE
jgi:uncharacterized membrane protein